MENILFWGLTNFNITIFSYILMITVALKTPSSLPNTKYFVLHDIRNDFFYNNQFIFSYIGFMILIFTVKLKGNNNVFTILDFSILFIIFCLFTINSFNFTTFANRKLDTAFIISIVFVSINFIMLQNILLFIITLASLNILTYTTLTINSVEKNSMEATIKYFVLSSISTLFIFTSLIFLISLTHILKFNFIPIFINHSLYNENTYNLINLLDKQITLQWHEIENIIWTISLNMQQFYYEIQKFTAFCYLLLYIGFFFKLALYPLHNWAQEIYSATSFMVLVIFLLLSKSVFLIRLLKIIITTFDKDDTIMLLLLFTAIGSSFTGSLSAIFETKLIKIMAYSSINQFGILIAGIVIDSTHKLNIIIIFWLIYLVTTVLFFISMTQLRNTTYMGTWILIITISTIFFSLSGVPPLGGFFTKFFIFTNLLWSNHLTVFLTLIFSSVLSLFYYLKIIKNFFIEKTFQNKPHILNPIANLPPLLYTWQTNLKNPSWYSWILYTNKFFQLTIMQISAIDLKNWLHQTLFDKFEFRIEYLYKKKRLRLHKKWYTKELYFLKPIILPSITLNIIFDLGHIILLLIIITFPLNQIPIYIF